MRQPTGKKSSAWFWVGFALLVISAFTWAILIAFTISEGDVSGILIAVIITAIPIGIGIYCVRRGRIPKTGKWWAWTAVRFLALSAIVGGILCWLLTEKTWMLIILSVLGIVGGGLLWWFASERWKRYD